MSRRVPFAPITGLTGVADSPSGEPTAVTYKLFLEIWEPGDAPFRRTLADLKRQYKWDQAAGTLRIEQGGGQVFILGPDVLAGLPDTTPMRINALYGPGVGPETLPPSVP